MDSISTPMATSPKVDADLSDTSVDQTNYQSMIGSLMYLISSRPDLMKVNAINMGLWYPKDSGFKLSLFSDVGHAGCLDTCKSTSGGIQFLGDKLVSRMSKKQDCTAMSTAEAECRPTRTMSTRPSNLTSLARKLMKAYGHKRMPEFNMLPGGPRPGYLALILEVCTPRLILMICLPRETIRLRLKSSGSRAGGRSGSGGGADDHKARDEDLNGDDDEGH
ncbi:hypothetical protein Tco_0212672 [Tanacetum coccineum]